MIVQTCRQLNQAAQRRQAQLQAGATYASVLQSPQSQSQQQSQQQQLPLLACRRVKVRFNDEPGEGSGVARAFYTAFSLVCSLLRMFRLLRGFCVFSSNVLSFGLLFASNVQLVVRVTR